MQYTLFSYRYLKQRDVSMYKHIEALMEECDDEDIFYRRCCISVKLLGKQTGLFQLQSILGLEDLLLAHCQKLIILAALWILR